MSEAIDRYWQARRERMEADLARIVVDPKIEREWRRHTAKLERRLRLFVTWSVRLSRLALIRKLGFQRGSLRMVESRRPSGIGSSNLTGLIQAEQHSELAPGKRLS